MCKRIDRLTLGIVGIASLAGCTQHRTLAVGYGMRPLAGVERSDVLLVAETALTSSGYAIGKTDSVGGTVTSLPLTATPYERGGETDRFGPRDRLRRVATVRVVETDGDVNVYCRVVVEEQVTEAYRLLRQQQSFSDVPDDTPIDREAATTAEQNAVWRAVRRDRLEEQRILDAIVTRAEPLRTKRGG